MIFITVFARRSLGFFRCIATRKTGFRLAVALALVVAVNSCARSNPLGDMDLGALKEQIQRVDEKTLRSIQDSPEARNGLQALHPGAQYYLARSLEEQGAYNEAVALYRTQLSNVLPAWYGVSFRGWLSSLRAEKDWKRIRDEGPQLYDQLYGSAWKDENPASLRERDESREAWEQAYLEALGDAKDWKSLLSAADGIRGRYLREATTGVLPLGDADYPSWLAYFRAKASLRMALAGVRGPKWTPDLVTAVLPYALHYGAKAGHTEIYQLALPLLNQGLNPEDSLVARSLVQILRVKDLVARNQTTLAFQAANAFFLPSESKRMLVGLGIALERAGGESGSDGNPFIADMYDAARLSGRLSDGSAFLDKVLVKVINARSALKRGALPAYILELKARLIRARNDNPAAAKAFTDAVTAAQTAERAKVLAASDRRRVQWYLLRSYTDQSDDLATDSLFDVNAFAKAAAQTDDAEYFADVFEKALLAIGGRNKWRELDTVLRQIGGVADPVLVSKYSLVAARALQLAGFKSDADKQRFTQLTDVAVNQKQSLYYFALAKWMRGEPFTVMAFLQDPDGRSSQNVSDLVDRDADPRDWTEIVSHGYWDMAMYDDALDYAWTYRRDLSFPWLTQLGRNFITVGRYRQGLRILESIRLRAGHPPQAAVLRDFYPRPYETELQAALQGKTIPDWLMFAMVRTESNFDTSAKSGPGAQGLAQLMPATADAVAQGLRLGDVDVLDPSVNLKLGATFLQDQYQRQKNWPQALAAYNAGQGRVRGWLRAGLSGDSILFSELIPFDETRNYVRRIVESSLIYTMLSGLDDPGPIMKQLLE